MLAGICLYIPKGLDIGHEQKSARIEEGLRLVDLFKTKMKDKK